MAILISAALWGLFQVVWRLLSESRHLGGSSYSVSRLGILVDTMTTLGMVGLCNLLFAWPLLCLFHWNEFEVFELPPRSHLWLLLFNALAEVAFDTSCAIAIYVTSPVMTSITAPLTIPISLVAEKILYGTSSEAFGGVSGWSGAIIILLGVVLMETKPKLGLARENAALLETDMGHVDRNNQELI